MFSENKKSIFKFHKRGFTLVELIIVITILAVLATIAFVSFQGYTTQSRDATRASTIKAIESGLEIFYTKAGVYPLPDDEYGQCVMTGTTLNHVGYAGDLIIKQINMNEVPVDPLHNSRYIYGVSADQRFFQVAGVFETDIAGTPSLMDRSLAVSSQTTRVKGNYEYPLSYQNQLWPLPSLLFVGTQGATSTGYTVAESDTMLFITDKGTNLPTSRPQDGDIGKKSVTELLQELTGTSVVLHPVSIPSDMTVKKLKDMDETEFQEKFGDLGVEKKDIARAIYGRKYYDGTSVTSSSSGGGTSSSSSGGGDPDGGSTPPLTGIQSIASGAIVANYGSGIMWQSHKYYTDGLNINGTGGYLVSYCDGLELGGFSDWRVPTVDELKSLNPTAIDTTLFERKSGEMYYSSDGAGGTTFSFMDYFFLKAHALGAGEPIFYIRCVRSIL